MKPLAVLILSCTLAVPIFAQRNAPVFGDAARLLELLSKDYGTNIYTSNDVMGDQRQVVLLLVNYIDNNDDSLYQSLFTGYDSLYNRIIRHSKIVSSKNARVELIERNKMNVAVNSRDLVAIVNDKRDIIIAQDSVNMNRYETNMKTLDHIRDYFKNQGRNNYLELLSSHFRNKYEGIKKGLDPYARLSQSSSVPKALPFFGGDLALETVVEGLSQFLSDRIKEELTTHVIAKVKDWLNESRQDGMEELKILMPRTRDYILAFKASQVTHFPSEIKQYIEDDLNHLLENAAKLKNTARMQQLTVKHPTVGYALEAVDLIPRLSGLKDPVDFFDVLDNSPTIAKWRLSSDTTLKNAAASIDLCGLLVRSLTVNVNGQVRFVGSDLWNAYKGDDLFLKTYIGLLLQQDRKYVQVKFSKGKNELSLDSMLTKLMEPSPSAVIAHRQFQGAIDRISAHAQTIQTSAEQIRKASKLDRRVGPDTTFRFVGAVIDFTEELAVAADSVISGLYKVYKPAGDMTGEDTISNARLHVSQYCAVARACNEMVLDLRQKNYAIAIIKALELTRRIQPKEGLENASLVLYDLDRMWDQQRARDWNRLRKNFATNDGLGSSRRLRRSIQRLEQDFRGLSNAIRSRESLKPSMDALEKALPELKRKGRSIDAMTVSSVKPLFAADEFKDVLFAYYSRHEADALDLLVGDTTKSTVTPRARKIANDILCKTARKEARQDIDILMDGLGNKLNAAIQRTDAGLDPKLVRMVHFVNDMAKAETPEDVNAALKAFALPAGSYAIKRESVFNVSLNSYPGLLGGGTFPVHGKGAWALGFTAPVGLSFTWGIPPGKKGRSGHSIGLYLPVIDIGALTRLQFDDDPNTEYLPELSFHNIAAPGAYLHFGFRNTPLSLNLGGQYGPRMRYADGEMVEERDAWRFGLGLVLDIPIATLHNKPMIR